MNTTPNEQYCSLRLVGSVTAERVNEKDFANKFTMSTINNILASQLKNDMFY